MKSNQTDQNGGCTTFKAYRLEVVRTKIAQPQYSFNASVEVAKRYCHLAGRDREHLIRLDLDSRNRLIGEETVSIGTADSSLVHPREVFKGAILNGAVHIIIIHNHPSGTAVPSDEDQRVLECLQNAGKLLGIPLLDFLIIGEDGRYWSSNQGEGWVAEDEITTPTTAATG
jgi:DNA repair protein RadC